MSERQPVKAHWEQVYASRDPQEVSWYQQHARPSLNMLREANIPASAAVVDVGGGASVLVDDLLDEGFSSLSVLDLSASALAVARSRLGEAGSSVRWIEADVLEYDFAEQAFEVWHDRAVFHFLLNRADRQRYVMQMQHALKPGGIAMLATFAEDGPERCSGLPTMRYSVASLQRELGASFALLHSRRERHLTPAGREQQFLYCSFQRRP